MPKLYDTANGAVSLSFFFPAYNEESSVEKLVKNAVEVLRDITDNYEILIINDGSTDHTAELGARLARKNAHIRMINHGRNKGYGAALRSGIQNSKKELIFYTDGDLQFDITELKKLMPLIEDADIISGYRIRRADTLYRNLVSWVFNLLCRRLYNLYVWDVNCAFKLYRRRIFDGMELKSVRGLIDAEILVKAQKAGYRIKQVGVHHYPRQKGRSKARFREIISTMLQMVQLHKELVGR